MRITTIVCTLLLCLQAWTEESLRPNSFGGNNIHPYNLASIDFQLAMAIDLTFEGQTIFFVGEPMKRIFDTFQLISSQNSFWTKEGVIPETASSNSIFISATPSPTTRRQEAANNFKYYYLYSPLGFARTISILKSLLGSWYVPQWNTFSDKPSDTLPLYLQSLHSNQNHSTNNDARSHRLHQNDISELSQLYKDLGQAIRELYHLESTSEFRRRAKDIHSQYEYSHASLTRLINFIGEISGQYPQSFSAAEASVTSLEGYRLRKNVKACFRNF